MNNRSPLNDRYHCELPPDLWSSLSVHVLTAVGRVEMPLFDGELEYVPHELPTDVRGWSKEASRSTTRVLLGVFQQQPLALRITYQIRLHGPDHDRPLRESDAHLTVQENSASRFYKKPYWYVRTSIGFLLSLIAQLAQLMQVPANIPLNDPRVWPCSYNVSDRESTISEYEKWLNNDMLDLCDSQMRTEIMSRGYFNTKTVHFLQQGMFQLAIRKEAVLYFNVPALAEVNRHYFIPFLRDLRYFADNRLITITIHVTITMDQSTDDLDRQSKLHEWETFIRISRGSISWIWVNIE